MSRLANLPLRSKLLGSFGLVLALVLAQNALAFWTTASGLSANEWVDHTREALTVIAEGRTALVDMEAGYRGFLLTGEDTFLELYNRGRDGFAATLATLDALNADNPPQLERWSELRRMEADWRRAVVEPGLALRRAGGSTVERIADFERGSQDKARVDAMEVVFDDAAGVERALLAARQAMRTAAADRLLAALVIGSAVVALLAVGIALGAARGIGGPVGEVAAAARRIARDDLPGIVAVVRAISAGDLTRRAAVTTTRLPVRSRDELGAMAQDFNEIVEQLEEASGELDVVVRAVAGERDTLRATLEAAQDGILIVDDRMQPTLTNRRFAEWFGVSATELRGLNVAERTARTMTRVDGAAELLGWADELRDEPERSEVRRIRLAGPERDVDCYTAPVLDTAGGTGGRVFVLHDVTREAELARTKDELVSVVSHELRTPLASLVGFAELLLSRAFAPSEQREFLGIMLEEGRRLTALINDFLDLQRLESGRTEIRPVPTALTPLLERTIVAAGDDPTRPIRLDVPVDLPLVSVDGDRIVQVVTNLLSNARKYSPNGGEIRIGARVVDGTVEVSIADHGLGIPPEALPQLFERFYRVDNSDRREIAGTGLGLAVSQQIVAAHGGRISAASEGLGLGASFTFSVPVFQEPPASGDVLVVEDDPGFARLVAAEMASVGLTVARCPDAEQALAHIARARPRAIVLDLMLPGLQGETFLARLRGATTMPIPVVVVTVKDLDEDEHSDLVRHGARVVLRKGPGVATDAAQIVLKELANGQPLVPTLV